MPQTQDSLRAGHEARPQDEQLLAGRQFNRTNFGLRISLKNRSSFGLRFPTLIKKVQKWVVKSRCRIKMGYQAIYITLQMQTEVNEA